MNIDKFTSLYDIGVLEYEENSFCPAVRPLEASVQVDMTPIVASGFLTALFECMVDLFPDRNQIEFEKETLKLFKKMVKLREQHTEKVKFTE